MSLTALKHHRCLLILDNIEAILREGVQTGQFREGYEGYGQLIQQISEMPHQSCILLTSREKPRIIVRQEGRISPVRSLHLYGLGQTEGKEILKNQGLSGSDEIMGTLIQLYGGNPLALKLISEPIREVFEGDISRFMKEEEAVFGDILNLLDQQFHRLSNQELEVLYWLAIEREPISLDELRKDISQAMLSGILLESLNTLRQRSMIETSALLRFN